MQRPSVGLGPKVTVMVVRLGDSKFPVPYSNRIEWLVYNHHNRTIVLYRVTSQLTDVSCIKTIATKSALGPFGTLL